MQLHCIVQINLQRIHTQIYAALLPLLMMMMMTIAMPHRRRELGSGGRSNLVYFWGAHISYNYVQVNHPVPALCSVNELQLVQQRLQ